MKKFWFGPTFKKDPDLLSIMAIGKKKYLNFLKI
jgi:hypothetical protein